MKQKCKLSLVPEAAAEENEARTLIKYQYLINPFSTNWPMQHAAPGPRAAEPAGSAGFLPDFCLRAGPWTHLLVHRCWAFWPAWQTHCHGLHQHAQLGRKVCSGASLPSITGGFKLLVCIFKVDFLFVFTSSLAPLRHGRKIKAINLFNLLNTITYCIL